MFALVEDLPRVAGFHDLAGVHHLDALGHLGHHAQIVGDQDDRGAVGLLQVLHDVQDLRLHGHVQRRGRLVRDQDLGIAGQGHGDHHALALAAGHGVGIAAERAFGIRQAHLGEHVHRDAPGLAHGDLLVAANALAHLLAHAHGGIQAGHGVLEDHGELLAPVGLHLLVAELGEILALEQDFAALEAHWGRGQQLHDGLHAHALAAAGFADDGEGLARIQVEIDAAHRLHFAGIGVKGNAKIAHFQQMLLHACSPPSLSDGDPAHRAGSCRRGRTPVW